MSSIKVTKYGQGRKVIAQTTVNTIEQARAFLDSLDDAGNIKAPTVAIPLPLVGRSNGIDQLIDDDEAAFERQYAAEHPDDDYLGRG